jgi:peptidoglycan/LPS O-acetylase OafA/YrhL
VQYRPDIDGLRALAILTVVLFHAQLGPFYGGFVGVDVFFVISGYLITGLIAGRLREDQFSFWDFYARRARRIFPALFVLILAVLVFGYFILTPGEYENVSLSAAYSSAFMANVYFWLHTGYFDQAADTMPLLHLWSIGVEEQFYFVWPLALFLLSRLMRASRLTAAYGVAAVTILLFILCVFITNWDVPTAFYLPFARFWEFTLGALVLTLPTLRPGRLTDVLSVLGFAAVLGAALFFNEDLAYPGYYAALPCAGATLMIAAGEHSLVGRLLALRPSVFIGKVSYSFYLWHWPVLAYYAYYNGGSRFSLEEKQALVLLAFAISIVSWRFIEMPIRRRRGVPWRHVVAGVSVAASVCAISLFVFRTGGFPDRIPDNVRALGNEQAMMAFDCPEDIALPGDTGGGTHCIVGAPWEAAARHAIIWGDSHARHMLSLLDIPAREQNLSIAHWPGCPPFVDNEALEVQQLNKARFAENCVRSYQKVLDWIAKTPDLDLVIISDAWASYPRNIVANNHVTRARALEIMEQGLVRAFDAIDPKRHPILILGDVPRPGMNIPKCVMRNDSGLLRRPCRRVKYQFTEKPRESENLLKKLAANDDHIFFHDSLAEMCSGPRDCTAEVGGQVIYRDRNHLRHDLNIDIRQQIVSMLGLRDALTAATAAVSSRQHAEGTKPQH